MREDDNDQEILLILWVVKGEFASPNWHHFPAKIADFGLKYCILKENAKNSNSGSKFARAVAKNAVKKTSSFDNLAHPEGKRIPHVVTF